MKAERYLERDLAIAREVAKRILEQLDSLRIPRALLDDIIEKVDAQFAAEAPEDLLTCPFDNGPGYTSRTLRDGYESQEDDPDAYAWFVTCKTCACQGPWTKSESGAKRMWNMRTVEEEAERIMERYKKALHDLAVGSSGVSEGAGKETIGQNRVADATSSIPSNDSAKAAEPPSDPGLDRRAYEMGFNDGHAEGKAYARGQCGANHIDRAKAKELIVKAWLYGWNEGYDADVNALVEADTVQREAEAIADRLLGEIK
jgi:hypothetical protein